MTNITARCTTYCAGGCTYPKCLAPEAETKSGQEARRERRERALTGILTTILVWFSVSAVVLAIGGDWQSALHDLSHALLAAMALAYQRRTHDV